MIGTGSIAAGKKPDWLKIKSYSNDARDELERLLAGLSLHTVCEAANCPNMIECYCGKTAAFMILGSRCTRNCAFCDVRKGNPEPVDSSEPEKLAKAVRELNLAHVVVTSVTRDDLPDGGASHFAAVIAALRDRCPGVRVEVLTPDFQGNLDALATVVRAKPDVLNHNIETVPRLYAKVRPMADYARSIDFLANAKRLDPSILTKSGLMLGLGEEAGEVLDTLRDLRNAGCDFLTIGQYLPPSKLHYPLVEYVRPSTFELFRQTGLGMGFSHVASGPLVRSSYRADRAFMRTAAGEER
jgi:lipoic acid synthetase